MQSMIKSVTDISQNLGMLEHQIKDTSAQIDVLEKQTTKPIASVLPPNQSN